MFRTVVWTAALLAAPSSLLAQSYTIATVAGAPRLRDGQAANTTPLRLPASAAQDAAGNIYIADESDHRIRKVAPDGTISTVAGTGTPGYSGDQGPATQARLDSPRSVVLDRNLNLLYIADWFNNRIRRVNLATGIITTFAGNGSFRYSGEGGQALAAGFDPDDLAIDAESLYIADFSNHGIRKIQLSSGIFSTLAGLGRPGDTGDNGPGPNAAVAGPTGITVDGKGVVYFCDFFNNRIRKIDTRTGIISAAVGDGFPGTFGDGGPAVDASLLFPSSVAADAEGNLMLVSGNFIRRVTAADGIIRTVGGSELSGFFGEGDSVSVARFAFPGDIVFGPNNDVLISDRYNNRLRRIRGGLISTAAGTSIGDGGPGSAAFFNSPSALALDAAGNLSIADSSHFRVRRIAATGGVISTIAGNGVYGSNFGRISPPSSVAADRQGTVYFAEEFNSRIQRVLPNGTVGIFAGTGEPGFSGDGGPAQGARLSAPQGLAVDSQGSLYIADFGNNRVRKIDVETGAISTIAGNGLEGSGGDGGPALQARLQPIDIAVDSAGNLYVADALNHRIRRIAANSQVISTIAGIGSPGHSGDGGPAAAAQLFLPTGVALDSQNNLYIADLGNAVIRRVNASDGKISTIAGNGRLEFNQESGAALATSISPTRIVVEPNGGILFTDQANDRVRRLALAVPAAMTISSGNNQSGIPGQRVTVAVRAADATGIPVAGVAVTFAVSSGPASIASPQAITSADGIASVQVTLGPGSGAVRVTASAAGLSSVAFSLTVTIPPPPGPTIDDGGVQSAGLSFPPLRALSVNAIATVFGQNFAAPGPYRAVGQADLVNNRAPTVFGGICVEAGSARAPIFGYTDKQVNFQVPAVGTSGSVAVRVIVGCGTPAETSTNAIIVPVRPATPEFFYFVRNPDGRNPVAAVDAVTYAYIAAPGLIPGAIFTPAQPGQLITIFVTGGGLTAPSFAPGEIPLGIASLASSIRVLIDGAELPADAIQYAGIAPFNPGLYQLNIYVPSAARDGDLSISLEIAGLASPPGSFLTVRRAAVGQAVGLPGVSNPLYQPEDNHAVK